eukprot:1299546-Amphidinium_carterae.2
MPLTRKGATDFATAKLVEWLRSLGHRRLILQSDREPAMLRLKEEVRMQLPGVEVIPRESAVGDHESNGAAEAAIRRVKDMTRSQVAGIENALGAKMTHGHVLTLFALLRAAHCLNCYRAGRTAEELRTGREWRKTIAVFRERVLGYPLKLDSQKRDLEAKAVSGLFVGYAPRTATTLLLTEEGVLRTRGMARQTEPERWNYKLETYRTGTPWNYNKREDMLGETATAVPPPAIVPSQSGRCNIERWGAQPGSFPAIVRDVKVTFSHTQACRDRIKAALEQEGDQDGGKRGATEVAEGGTEAAPAAS